jgi:hydrogenase maturation protease
MPVESAKLQTPERLLVIGFGNDLRGDDGAGRLVANSVANWRCHGVRTISTHQLTPDHALDIANADRVLFVDASFAVTPDDVCILKRLPEAASRSALTHHVEPAEVLAMAHLLYDAYPETWLLTIPGSAFSVGDAFSPTARRNSEIAQELIRSWLAEIAD